MLSRNLLLTGSELSVATYVSPLHTALQAAFSAAFQEASTETAHLVSTARAFAGEMVMSIAVASPTVPANSGENRLRYSRMRL